MILFNAHIFSNPKPKHYFPLYILAYVPRMLNSYRACKVGQIMAPGMSLTTFHRCFFRVAFFFPSFGKFNFLNAALFFFCVSSAQNLVIEIVYSKSIDSFKIHIQRILYSFRLTQILGSSMKVSEIRHECVREGSGRSSRKCRRISSVFTEVFLKPHDFLFI